MSPPCFFLAAEASAASSASKMTSLATPFSCETASTTFRISLLIASLPPAACSSPRSQLRYQPRLLDPFHGEGDLHAVDLEQHRTRAHTPQPAPELPPPV